VSYLLIAIVWVNHHYLLRYADQVTSRLLWLNFAHLFFDVSSAALYGLDGDEQAGFATRCVLRGRLLPCERDVHRLDSRTHRASAHDRDLGPGAQDHARSIDHDALPVRIGGRHRAEISARWLGNLHLLLDRLSETGATGN
jgi:hypothetical protein